MIRASSTDHKYFFLVLEPGNIERLKLGQPIKVNLAELGGPDLNIIIHYAEDIEDAVEQFKAAGIMDYRDERGGG